ncbi:hypothetical protein Tco_0857371 [Tanacetum coccineum]|uniref:Uncharacterized protein n=1 Tax=Tanacetum coccineum TaxID=301880 RepID=A0ABQ5BBR9_9ASTR
MEDPRESFNELMDTPLDFSAFVMNRLKVDTLTPKLLAGLTFELMKGSCKSLVELEYFFEEVYKETTDQLDWNNPEGQQYPHDLRKPLPLIPNSRVTKTKAADYRHIKWIKDLVPNTMWSQVLVSYDKHALWVISHWGRKRQQFYGFAANRESAHDVYSKRRIIVVTKLQIVKWHNYKHLDWITVRRDDDKLYTFKEGDFNRLHIQYIEDMLLLLVQGKLTNITVEERLAFNLSKEAQLMNGTLNDVRTALDDRLKGIWMKYLPQTIWRQSDKDKAGAMIQAIDKQLKTRRIIRSLEKFVGGRPYDTKGEKVRFGKSATEMEHSSGTNPIRFDTSAVNPVKEILLKLNLPDHRILKDGGEVKKFQRSFCHSDIERLSRSDEVLKLKNFKKDATLKLFKSTNKERCSRSHSRQAKEQAQDLKSMITTSNHKIND